MENLTEELWQEWWNANTQMRNKDECREAFRKGVQCGKIVGRKEKKYKSIAEVFIWARDEEEAQHILASVSSGDYHKRPTITNVDFGDDKGRLLHPPQGSNSIRPRE